MTAPGFVVYSEDIEYFDGFLSMDQVGKVVAAVIVYQNTGTKQIDGFNPLETVLFRMMISKADRDREKYESKRKKLAENGSRGGRPSKKENQKNQMVSGENQMVSTVTVSETETVTETGTENEFENGTVSVVSTVGPSLREVTDYCTDNHKNIPLQKFLDYYGERGWKRKDGKPLDWRAAVDYWASTERRDGSGSGGAQKDSGGPGPGVRGPGYNPAYDHDIV